MGEVQKISVKIWMQVIYLFDLCQMRGLMKKFLEEVGCDNNYGYIQFIFLVSSK
jgi:hypothetical protein